MFGSCATSHRREKSGLSDGKTFPDGMGQEDLTNALTVCAGQLIRIADTLDELNKSLKKVVDKTDGHLCIKGMVENL